MAINLHPGQSEIFQDIFIDQIHRFVTCVCSRGFGKSFFGGTAAATAAMELLELDWRVPNKKVGIVAPTFDQVTDIYYPMLAYDIGLADIARKHSKDTGRFLFDKNVEIHLLSYESVERMRGKGYYFLVWDEPSSCTKGITPKDAWEGIMMPCIITRWSEARAKLYKARSPGRGLIIGTPKGYNYFHDLYNMPERDPRWGSYHYDYTESPLIDPQEIELIRHTIDPIVFASEYKATFEDSGASVFYCFDRKVHVRKDLPYFHKGDNDNEPEIIHAMIDFNVGLQCTSFWAERGQEMHCLDEFKGHPDTETLALAIKEQFIDEGHKVYAYPDPSGRARKTSAPVGRTDFSILQGAGIKCLARERAPPIVDSVACVNQMFMTAAGDIRAYVHPRCVGTVNSLERTKWVDKNPDSATLDKSEGVEHFSDGIRYGFEFKFPIKQNKRVSARGFNF
jgi:hypothetical protein